MDTNSDVPIDLGRLIDEGAWTAFQKWVILLAALAFCADGLANQVLGVALPALIADWHAPRAAFAPVAAIGLIGVALGTVAGGVLGDRIGRRRTLIGAMLLFGAMTVAASRVGGMAELGAVRFFGGLGIGAAIPSGTALIAEFTPLRRRSVAISISMLFIPVGGLVAGVFGALILPHSGWRALFTATGLATLAIAALFAAVLPESPRFLLRWPARRANLVTLLGRIGHPFAQDAAFVDEAPRARRAALTALFGRGAGRDTAALWGGFFFCFLALYTLLSWLPTLLGARGLGFAATSLSMTSLNAGSMAGGLLTGVLMQRFGSRRTLPGMAGGAVAAALALSFMPIHAGSMGAVATLLTVEGLFIGGIQTGLYTLAAAAYPPFIRATGVGAASAFGRIGAIASSFTGVVSMDLGGAKGFFLCISLSTALSLGSILVIRRHVAPA